MATATGVRSAAAERRQPAVVANSLEAGNDRDGAAAQRLVERRGFDRFDPGIAVDARGPDQLPAHEAARLGAHVLEGHGEEAGGDLLAAGDDHVIFLGVILRACLAAQLDEAVGLAGHRRDDHQNLIARLCLPRDQPGDMADALDPRHRRAAELHHDAGHGGDSFLLWRDKRRPVRKRAW